MINQELLLNIRRLCKEHDVNIAYLEKQLGIGAGTISRWNKANPSLDKIVGIAKYFHVSVDDLIGYSVGREEDSEAISDSTQGIINYLLYLTRNNSEKSFWHLYSDLSNEVQLNLSGLVCSRSENDQLLYAVSEDGFFLLQVTYLLNDKYDFETSLRLYLLPDESSVPVLECDQKRYLQELFIAARRSIEKEIEEKENFEKVENQRERLLRKYNELKQENEEMDE